MPLRSPPWAIAGWAAAMLPAVAAGRPVADLPRIYTGQVAFFDDLTLNAPNLYQWVRIPPGGLAATLAFAAVVIGAVMLWLARQDAGARDDLMVRAVVLLLLLVPFVLPRMHERYTFPADVLAVAYAVVVRHGWLVAAASSTISALAYLPFAAGILVPLALLAGLELALILLVALGLVGALDQRPAAVEPVPEPAST